MSSFFLLATKHGVSLAASLLFLLAGGQVCASDFAQIGAGAGDLAEQCAGRHRGTAEQVIESCTRAIESTAYHGQVWPYFGRALGYSWSGRLDLAIADYETGLKMQVKPDGITHIGYASACLDRALINDDLDRAKAECEQALALKPTDSSALNARAVIKYRTGDFAGALTDFDKAFSLSKMTISLYMRGLTKMKLNDVAGGNTDIAAAKVENPDIEDVYGRYGITP